MQGVLPRSQPPLGGKSYLINIVCMYGITMVPVSNEENIIIDAIIMSSYDH